MLADFLNHRAADTGDDDVPPLPSNRVHTGELFDALGIAPADQTKDKAQRLRIVMEAVLGWHHRRGVRVLDRASAGYTREKLKAWRERPAGVNTPNK